MSAMSQQRTSQACSGPQAANLPAGEEGDSDSAQLRAEYDARLAAAADKAEKVTPQFPMQAKVHQLRFALPDQLRVQAECQDMLSICLHTQSSWFNWA